MIKFTIRVWAISILLSATGLSAPAQQLQPVDATEVVKEVVWEMAKEAGKVSTIAGMGLDVMEIMLIDTQMYGDVGRGIYWSDSDNRQYEYDWGKRDAAIPRGDGLFRIYQEMKKAGVISQQEMRDVFVDMQKSPSGKWRMEDLPETVQKKINAVVKISNSPDRKDIVKNAVQRVMAKSRHVSGVVISFQVDAGAADFRKAGGQVILGTNSKFITLDVMGGCGPNDYAECNVNENGEVAAYYRDSCAPGNTGPWVASGCSTATHKHYTATCCIVE